MSMHKQNPAGKGGASKENGMAEVISDIMPEDAVQDKPGVAVDDAAAAILAAAHSHGVYPENIPAELRERRQWVCWKLGPARADGKRPKKPMNAATGRAASATDPTTWNTFETALVRLARGKVDGVGYVFSPDDGIVGIDLDNCREPDGTWSPWAVAIVEELDSFCEVSPSGNGLHIYVRAVIGDDLGNKRGPFENYAVGRFFTTTGRAPELDYSPGIEERQEQLDAIRKRMLGTEEPEPKAEEPAQGGDSVDAPPLEADLALLMTSFTWRKGSCPQAKELWEGNLESVKGDDSAGDFQLCRHLAWLFKKNHERIDRAFRKSALLREKWDSMRGPKATYGDVTIVRAIEATRAVYSPTPVEGPRPDGNAIVVRQGQMHRVADEIEAAFMAADLPERFRLFQRYKNVVRVCNLPVVAVAACGDKKTASIAKVDRSYLLGAASRLRTFVKYDARSEEYKPCNPPAEAVDIFLSNFGHWKLPPLRAILGAPAMRTDGTIIDCPGYDAASMCYLPAALPGLEAPDKPTLEDARVAAEMVFQDLLAEFPFDSTTSKFVAMSLLLTALARPMVPFAPLHLITAPTPGSGKSYLVDLASVLALGKEASALAVSTDPAEFSKALGALLLEGAPIIALDNINSTLESDLLCQAVSQPYLKVRTLGESNAPEMANTAMFCLTGNNASVAADLVRRTLVCRLDPAMERPELRRFKGDPVAKAKAERGRYVSALLTIMKAYAVAGRPKTCEPLANFVGWGDMVRSALLWICPDPEADPVKSQETVVADDAGRNTLRMLLIGWKTTFGARPKTVAELCAWTKEDHEGEAAEGLQDALREAGAERNGVLNQRSMGKWLARHAGRVASGIRLVKADSMGTRARWKVEF